MEKLNKFVESLLKWLQRFFDTGTVLSLTGIILVVSYQILARYSFQKSPVWTEELSRYLFIYCVVLASGTVIIKKRHVRLELFQHKLSEKWSHIYGIICHLLIFVFCLILIQYSWKYMIVGDRKTSPTMGMKMSWVFASTFIFFVLVCLTCLLMTVKDAVNLLKDKKS